MRVPDPKANTTTKAYLAYKAGYLEESELKPKLYKPDWHFDGWLAYWAGLVNTYPTKENGDPEMLTDEEALVAYLSGVTDTYPEEIKDPYDVRIVGYLRHLVSIRWPEPDYPVNNEEFYLSTMEPTHTSNPEPSSDIELDTAEGKIISVEAYGDTYQQTYSGANLFDVSTFVMGGMTNGHITTSSYRITNITMPLKVYPNTTYTISVNLGGDIIGFRIGLHQLDANKSFISDSDWQQLVPNPYTFTTGPNTEFIGIVCSCSVTSTTVTTGTTESGYNTSNATQWLRGCTLNIIGDYISPSPDAPTSVQTVTGEQTVKVTGKNMAQTTDCNISGTNYSMSISKGSVELKSQATNVCFDLNAGTRLGAWMPNYASAPDHHLTGNGGTYIASFHDTSTSGLNDKTLVGVFTNKRNNSITINNTLPLRNISISLDSDEYVKSILYWIGSESTDCTIKFKVQLEQGSTSSAYEPYQGQSYEINLGKNLFDKNTLSDGWTTLDGRTNTDSSWKHTDYVSIYPSTPYTTSGFVNGSGTNPARCYYDANKVFISGTKHNNAEPFTDTSPSNARYMIECCKTTDIDTLQIELGTTATDYAPYFTPIELSKIGDYQDYIYRDADGDWYVHNEIGKYTFTGNESWQSSPYGTNSWNIYALFNFTFDTTELEIISEAFRGVPHNQRGSAGNNIIYVAGHNVFEIRNTSLASQAAVQSATSGTDMYYAVETPTDTQITDATLVGQLEALAGADTYNEKTYIKVTATDPNLPALLKVEAYKY